MKAHRFENFILAFLVQKIAEYVLLSLCLAVQFYVGTRLPDPTAWGIFGEANVNLSPLVSIAGGLAAAFAFFLFTLYPVVTLAIVALGRNPLYLSAQNALPWFSAAVSVGYVVLWVVITDYHARIVPFWIVTAVMAAFIVASSAMLYPPARSD